MHAVNGFGGEVVVVEKRICPRLHTVCCQGENWRQVSCLNHLP